MTAKLHPQLRMVRAVDQPLPQPLSRTFRTAGAGDAESIACVLQDAFGEPWDSQRADQELISHPNVPMTFVVELDGKVVASASYQLQPEFPNDAFAHWVGVHSSARGHRFGQVITWAVLEHAKSEVKERVLLTTDDFRIPAIKTYLALGFEPDNWHESHLGRWDSIFKILKG